jgi:hypothetical protein
MSLFATLFESEHHHALGKTVYTLVEETKMDAVMDLVGAAATEEDRVFLIKASFFNALSVAIAPREKREGAIAAALQFAKTLYSSHSDVCAQVVAWDAHHLELQWCRSSQAASVVTWLCVLHQTHAFPWQGQGQGRQGDFLSDVFSHACFMSGKDPNWFAAAQTLVRVFPHVIRSDYDHSFVSMCCTGSIERVQWLLDVSLAAGLGSMDIHTNEDQGFFAACVRKKGGLPLAQWLWARDGGAVCVQARRRSFHECCSLGLLEVMKWLWDLGGIDITEGAVFDHAVCSGDQAVVKWVLALGAEDTRSPHNVTRSCRLRHWDMAWWLYQTADKDAAIFPEAVMSACGYGNIPEAVKWAAEGGLDLSQTTGEVTRLKQNIFSHCCCFPEGLAGVDWLLAFDSPPVGTVGTVPSWLQGIASHALHNATMEENRAMLKKLVDIGLAPYFTEKFTMAWACEHLHIQDFSEL